MPGLIGKKIGMTSLYDENNKLVACTLIEAGPNFVTQVLTEANNGYNAVQLGFGAKKEKNTTAAMKGHFQKAGVEPQRVLHEFDFEGKTVKAGDELNVDLFEEGEFVDVVGTSKGKGFQGVVKRHGFSGVGGATHGQHNRLRAPGSVGACSFPGRTFPGIRMAGRMGGDRVKIQNVRILKVIADKNLLVISGPVPGAIGSFVFVEK